MAKTPDTLETPNVDDPVTKFIYGGSVSLPDTLTPDEVALLNRMKSLYDRIQSNKPGTPVDFTNFVSKADGAKDLLASIRNKFQMLRPSTPQQVVDPESATRDRDEEALARRNDNLVADNIRTQLGVNDSISDINKVRSSLETLARDHWLILHQTYDDSAKSITNSAKYFSSSGLLGTVIVSQDTNAIIQTMYDLDKPTAERTTATHRGSNSLVIMAFPKRLLNTDRLGYVVDEIDDKLKNKWMAGEIQDAGLPNNFVYGYYHAGRLNMNKNSNPDFL
jgi:hypothetical protein